VRGQTDFDTAFAAATHARIDALYVVTSRLTLQNSGGAAKASAMAPQAIDRLGDPLVTDEERRLRKRRLIKGPKEFRDIRKQSRED
jgi:hypothetical protein